MDHNNLRRFINTKSLSSRQVRWAQKLSRYHFQIDYCQSKANAAANALLRFPQKNQDEEKELRAENGRILHCWQNSLTNVSLASLSFFTLSHLHQVLICGTYVLSQLRKFWDLFRSELSSKSPYTASIGGMRLKLHKLQAEDKQAQKLRADQQPNQQINQQSWQDIDGVLHHQGFAYVPETIQMELIRKHHDDLLAGHFEI